MIVQTESSCKTKDMKTRMAGAQRSRAVYSHLLVFRRICELILFVSSVLISPGF